MTGSKKNLQKYIKETGNKIKISEDCELTIKRQCELLEISRGSVYYKPKKRTNEDINKEEYIKGRIDYWNNKFSHYGARRLTILLNKEDEIDIGKKLVKRYMREMNIVALYPKASRYSNSSNKKFPYLLKNKEIFMPNQVWAIDITYIKMGRTHMYLTAIIDWFSRFIVGFKLSDTLETTPVILAVQEAIDKYGVPSIINSDQGSQFTSEEYILFLQKNKIRQSMDGKARWVDNVIIERWFRSLKCEEIYINEYNTPKELKQALIKYIYNYNHLRPHSYYNGDYPYEVFFENTNLLTA